MTPRVYKDEFTLDGRIKPGLGVSRRKVEAVRDLYEAYQHGSLIAGAKLQEALTSSDAIFNLAHLANLNFIPNFDEADRSWAGIAGRRTVNDLKPVTLYSLAESWTDGNGGSQVLSDHGAAPVIPEGTPYPYAYISGEVAQGRGVVKRGFKTDWTLESRINDGLGALDRLPGEMLDVSLDTESADVWGALVAGGKGANAQLDGGTVPTGGTVTANSPLTRDALIRAQIELGNRTINGRKIQVNGGYNLIVPLGQSIYANFIINQTLATAQPSTTAPIYVYQVNGYDPLSSITVVESEWVTGTEWFLVPKVGATRRPVLERLDLRQYPTPQLFVENHVGIFVGGGAVSPFEGSFDADVITLKLRQFGGGVLWDGGEAVVYSEGDGT
jgi:hypothetical protein